MLCSPFTLLHAIVINAGFIFILYIYYVNTYVVIIFNSYVLILIYAIIMLVLVLWC